MVKTVRSVREESETKHHLRVEKAVVLDTLCVGAPMRIIRDLAWFLIPR
jgi:hypothetical protein